VVTTPNSGCGDFVEDGVNGWVVPIRDITALADRLAWSLENREQLEQMGDISRRKAAAWTWDRYAGVHAEAVLNAMHRLTGAQYELSAS
jgi:alpha-maltose-1-phosphate synthase